MFDRLINAIGSAVTKTRGLIQGVLGTEIPEDQLQEMAAVYKDRFGFTQEEAEAAATRAFEAMEMVQGAIPLTAASKIAPIAKKAFGRAVTRAEMDRVARKLFSELDKIKGQFGEVPRIPDQRFFRRVLQFAKSNFAPIAILLAASDVFFWAPNMLGEGLRTWGLGPWFDNLKFKTVGVVIGKNQAEDITRALHAEGFTDYFDLDTNERLDLTPANTEYLWERLRQRQIATGGKVDFDSIRKKIIDRAKKGAEAAPGVAAPRLPAVPAVIRIEGITAGELPLPEFFIEQISDMAGLNQAIQNAVSRFVSAMPGRLKLDISKKDFWISPNGKVIRPTPAFFRKTETEGERTTTKNIKNKIVTLKISFVNEANRAVNIFELPLDYSIADDVITPAPSPGEAAAQITIEIPSATPKAAPQALEVTPGVSETIGPSGVPLLTPPTEAEPFPLPQFRTGLIVPTIGLNIREKPTASSPVLFSLPRGAKIKTGQEVIAEADGFEWVVIEDPATGRRGFAAHKEIGGQRLILQDF